jgi:hypothetical protein
VLRFGRPLLAWYGLGRLERCFGWAYGALFTFSCYSTVSTRAQMAACTTKYLAGRSSELRARPVCYVSYAEVKVGCPALRRAGSGYPRSFGRTATVSDSSGLQLHANSPS